MKTTKETITPDQIFMLELEAGEAGDVEMAAFCRLAIRALIRGVLGDCLSRECEDALIAVITAINAAEAMDVSKDDVSNWETVASFVATFPSDDDEGACDVSVQIGEAGGQWFLRTTDDSGGNDDADETVYESRDAVKAAAEDLAVTNSEGYAGEDAEDYLTRKLTETAGEPNENGEWCVYWETSLDDSGPRDRYPTREAATAACEIANKALQAAHPGNLLCGFSVHRWEKS